MPPFSHLFLYNNYTIISIKSQTKRAYLGPLTTLREDTKKVYA